MKLLLPLFLFSLSAFSATLLDLKAGYWEQKTDLGSNPMMKQAMESLSKLPKEQREMVMKTMAGSGETKTVYTCFTEGDLKNWEKKLNEGQERNGCKIIVKKNTKSVYEAVRKCIKSVGDMEISFKMENSKKGRSIIKMAISPKPIESKMTWLSSNCPKK